MTIERLPSGSYRVKVQENGKRVSVTFPYKPTNKEIMIALAEKLQQTDSEHLDGTFLHYANEYISNRSSVLSPSSIRTYRQYTKMISDKFNAKHLYAITQSDIQSEINLFNQTHEPKTTRSLHGFIYAVLTHFRPSMVINTTLPQLTSKKPYLPTEDDIKSILEYVEGTEDEIVFKLGIMGLRRGEICALSVEDFTDNSVIVNKTKVYDDDIGWIIKDTPKTENSNRTVPLPPELIKKVRKQGFVFNQSPKKLNEHLHRVQKELGINQFRFHDLRHYFASYTHAIGIPDADIIALGGWKTDHVMKSIYRDSMEKRREENAKLILDSIF